MHLISLIPFIALAWAPSGDFEGGQLSPSGNQVALVQNGELGILDVSTGAWNTIDLPGQVKPPVKWSDNSRFIALAVVIEGSNQVAVLNAEDGSYLLSEKSGPIRSICWDNTGAFIAVSSQNNTASVPCTTYVYQLDETNKTINATLIFPARDPYFLSDGNIVCLAGNHFPPVRAGNRKPYAHSTGYAFVITRDGSLAAKIELFDDPSVWEVNSEGACVYAAGNKIYYAEISSSGKTKETLLSLQNGLIGNSLISAVAVNLAAEQIYCLWEIGSSYMLGVYTYIDPLSEGIILSGLKTFSTVFSNENFCVLSGDSRKGIYTPQGRFLLSFSGESSGSTDDQEEEASQSFSITLECPNLPDLFSSLKLIDESVFSFLPTSITPAYQIRVTRSFSGGETVYKIHMGSFNSTSGADPHIQEVQQITGKTARVERE